MTYGAETWVPTKVEMKQVQKNMDNAIKRIIRAPITTPSEIIIAETGIWDIETQVAKKQITYYHKIRTTSDPGSQLYNNTMDKHMEEASRKDNARNKHRCRRSNGEKPPTSKEIHYQQTKEAPDDENLQGSREQIKSKGLCLPRNNRNSSNKTKLHEQFNTQGMQQYIQYTCQNDKG